ncbi:MAG: Electron transfer flavoprotein alpha/beta-subunit [Proteobacteria bacterium]|nr:Electron transfer flavoprotein alpha/beta-subunit [Pseudomonadota bacterium]
MKILVALKRVPDYSVPARITPDGSDIEANKIAINPFDEIAVEAALRLSTPQRPAEIVVVSIGNLASQEVLRHALAMGADRAIRVETENSLEPLDVAKVLKAVAGWEQPDLWLLGKQAVGADAGQTGQMLAGLLGIGQATFVSALEWQGNELIARREVEGGTETLALKLPALVTTDLQLNTPRYIKLPNLIAAKRKPIETLTLAELGITPRQRIQRIKLENAPARTAGIKVSSVPELLEKLRTDAKVLS